MYFFVGKCTQTIPLAFAQGNEKNHPCTRGQCHKFWTGEEKRRQRRTKNTWPGGSYTSWLCYPFHQHKLTRCCWKSCRESVYVVCCCGAFDPIACALYLLSHSCHPQKNSFFRSVWRDGLEKLPGYGTSQFPTKRVSQWHNTLAVPVVPLVPEYGKLIRRLNLLRIMYFAMLSVGRS